MYSQRPLAGRILSLAKTREVRVRTSLPERGRDWPTVRDELEVRRRDDVDWRSGRASVYVFHSGDDVLQVALLPVAYTVGTDFKRAERPPAAKITHWDTW